MTTKWKSGNPTEPGWYDTFHGKAYWTGRRWANKKHGKTVHVFCGWRRIPINLTPWFDGSVKPVRKGWYDRDWDFLSTTNDYWDGENWFNGGKNNSKSSYPSSVPRKWRGILK